MPAVPGARAGPAAGRRRAHLVLDAARPGDPRDDLRLGRGLHANGVRRDEPLRVPETGLEPLVAVDIERQLPAEEPAIGEVESDRTGGREPRQRRLDVPRREPRSLRKGFDAEARLPAECGPDPGHARGPVACGEPVQRPALAREPPPHLRAQDDRQAATRHVQLPAGAAIASQGVQPEAGGVARGALEQPQASDPADRDGSTARVVVTEPQAAPDQAFAVNFDGPAPVSPRPDSSISYDTGDFAGASVTLASVERGFSRQAVTDGSGKFLFPVVPLGRYTVTVKLPNFETVSLANNVVEADRTYVIACRLEAARISKDAKQVWTRELVWRGARGAEHPRCDLSLTSTTDFTNADGSTRWPGCHSYSLKPPR